MLIERMAISQKMPGVIMPGIISGKPQAILDTAKNSTTTSGTTKDSFHTATEGKEIVHQAVQSITKLVESVGGVSRTIDGPGRNMEETGEIIMHSLKFGPGFTEKDIQQYEVRGQAHKME